MVKNEKMEMSFIPHCDDNLKILPHIEINVCLKVELILLLWLLQLLDHNECYGGLPFCHLHAVILIPAIMFMSYQKHNERHSQTDYIYYCSIKVIWYSLTFLLVVLFKDHHFLLLCFLNCIVVVYLNLNLDFHLHQ